LFTIDQKDAIIKNNIFVGYAHEVAINLYIGLMNKSNLDHNLYYFPETSGDIVFDGTKNRTLNELQAWGAEANSIDGIDPLFVDVSNGNFSIQSISPAIDAGVDLGSPYKQDKNAVSRPQGSGWDIGAYEFVGNFNNSPPPPQNLRYIIIY